MSYECMYTIGYKMLIVYTNTYSINGKCKQARPANVNANRHLLAHVGKREAIACPCKVLVLCQSECQPVTQPASMDRRFDMYTVNIKE